VRVFTATSPANARSIQDLMAVVILTLHLHIPGCSSLKDKRSRIKPLLARLHKEFNISVAEIAHQDQWQEAVIACAMISNDSRHSQKAMARVVPWIQKHRPDIGLISEQIEIL
jgi:uncharacterized protein YlxP (DUF503 family)